MESGNTLHRVLIFITAFIGFVGLSLAVWFSVWDVNSDLDEVTVVVSVPTRLSIGESIVNAVTLAFEEVDYLARDTKLSLSILDDGDEVGAWKEDLERKNAEVAVNDASVVAYIGTFNSGAAKISMPILNRAGIVQISPGNTWPGLTKPGFLPGEPGNFSPTGVRNYVRVCTTDDLQGPAGALWAQTLGFTSVFVVDDGEAYGAGIGALFSERAEEIGLDIVGKMTIEKADEAIDIIASAIKDVSPSLVYYAGITPNGGPELLRRIREIGIESDFMGPDGILESDFIRLAGESSEGVYATTVGIPVANLPSDEAKKFRMAYISRFGKEPEVFGAFAYEAAQIVINAIKNSDPVFRFTVLEKVKNTTDFDSMFGRFSFDQNGDTTLTLMSGNRVENGTFKFVSSLPSPF